MERSKITDYYLQKINDEDFDLYDMSKDLEKNNVEEDDIKIIVELVDSEIQRGLFRGSHRDKSKELMGIGVILVPIGAGITMGTYTGY